MGSTIPTVTARETSGASPRGSTTWNGWASTACGCCPVPARDGGYDISDFFTVHPDYGTVGDAAELIDEAHRRGMKVIADMVMNHTSDQHPWFIECALVARQSAGGLVRMER